MTINITVLSVGIAVALLASVIATEEFMKALEDVNN